MDLKETAKILALIQRIYPNRDKNAEENDLDATVKIWQRLFQYEAYPEVYMAFMNHAATNKFAPTPADLKLECTRLKHPDMFISSEVAWEKVCKAVRKFGFYQQSEAFKTFDEKLKRVVKAVGWGEICHSEKPEFVKLNFCKIWDNIQSVEKEELQLPFIDAVKVMKKYGELNESAKQLPEV